MNMLLITPTTLHKHATLASTVAAVVILFLGLWSERDMQRRGLLSSEPSSRALLWLFRIAYYVAAMFCAGLAARYVHMLSKLP